MPQSTFLPVAAPAGVSQPSVPCLPWIEEKYHAAMTDGRMIEHEIGQLIYEIKKMVKELQQWIQDQLNHIVNAILASLPPAAAPPACVAQIIVFVKQMITFINNVISTIKAVIQIIALLEAMIRNLVAMLQSILNAIANLLSQICNFHLPKLPSLAFLLGNLFNFQGFNLKGLKLGMPSMNLHFTFPQCHIQSPKPFYSPGLAITPYGNTITNSTAPLINAQYAPMAGTAGGSAAPAISLPVNPVFPAPDQSSSTPFSGFIVSAEQQADPTFVSQYLAPASTTSPLYSAAFNPESDFQGSLPAPASILNQFSLAPFVYIENVASTIPLKILPQVSASGFLTEVQSVINLVNVNQNRQPNVAAAWVIYLSLCRAGRSGQWIPEYDAIYQQYIAPSMEYVSTVPTPWNGFDPANIADAPVALPLLVTLNGMKEPELSSLLWKLSYVEASLLGYQRAALWDSSADPSWFGYTNGELDFTPTTIDNRTLSVILNSGGQAAYPSTILIDPLWADQVNQAIAAGVISIQNNPQFRSQNPSFRYIYDQFAIATEVDRFSQFWREWAANFNALVASRTSSESPTALPYVMNYWQAIDSNVNPLSDTTLYAYLYNDAITRAADWARGSNIINLPTALDSSASSQGLWVPPDDASAGWGGISPNLTFNAQSFLARPDIQALPLTTQLTMLDLNSAWATALTNGNNAIAQATQEISNMKNILASSVIQGFVVSNTTAISIPPSTDLLLKFNTVELDVGSNVTASNSFTIQTAGSYLVTGTFIFDAVPTPAARKIEVWVNSVPVFIQESANVVDSVTLALSETIIFNKGDVIQVFASTNGQDTDSLLSDFTFQCLAFTLDTSSYGFSVSADGQIIQTGGISTNPQLADIPGEPVTTENFLARVTANLRLSGTDQKPVYGKHTWGILGSGIKQQPAGTPLVSLTAVYTNEDGKALPISPEIDVATVPYYDGVALNNAAANQTVSTALMYGQEYQVITSTAMPVQAGNSPSGVAGSNVTPAVPSKLLTGQMLYVGPGGLLTQDYTYVQANCRWVVAVGRATDTDKFIYEPSIPMDQKSGGGQGGGNFTFTQATPALVWTIPNTLDRYVSVSVYDTDGEEMVRDVTFDGMGTIIVTLVVPSAGTAYCT